MRQGRGKGKEDNWRGESKEQKKKEEDWIDTVWKRKVSSGK